MRKPISPALHGALDYGFLGMMLVVPRLLGLDRRARALFGTFGAVQGTLNALTDQPLGVARLVPFATHGTAERDSLPLFVALPLLTGVLRDRAALGFFLGAGATLVTVYNLTDWDAVPDTRAPAR
ncbi:hypothetical protein [Pseudonocardia sp. KRD291]|uniref:hypothetical protein n=1 Tax=Pseudonocardia sp. KRD291 TaxID=2792007 RepID=UPI001C4A6F2A|nr:hypothetical protein [Pseudonocardia sp. KRD291]MBW0101339.1 hypothetical protein [Pseudonocardia sp. KRD291]